MAKRIFKSIVFVSFLILMVSVVFVTSQIYSDFVSYQLEELEMESNMIAYGIERDGLSFLDKFEEYQSRITVITSDGKVIYDNRQDDVDQMDNHLDRQEVQEAIKNGYGTYTRYSSTKMTTLTYAAIRLNNNWIVRLSSEYYSVFSVLLSILGPLLLVTLLMIALSSLLANNLAKSIVEPINTINMNNADIEHCYKEIRPFMETISLQQKQIQENIISLERRKQEFETITENMNAGMLLLNSKNIVLEMNYAASQILNLNERNIGMPISECAYYPNFQNILEKAENRLNYNKRLSIDGKTYEIEASPIVMDGIRSGMVLLLFDNSYKEANEKIRREFSSNVSHELKTPLQTISGYAELLKNNMVRQEDYPQVAEKIYDEAQHMISLVNDIIKLSRLDDEEVLIPMEEVDLYPLTTDAVEEIRLRTKEAKVQVSFHGKSEKIIGNTQLLESILFNLLDNAVKYNRENGRVSVNLFDIDNKVYLQVTDTGLGIEKANLERIFERFYRTDKARSRKVSGTGLGLSIVKHAVILNNGRIEVSSELDKGTCFTVIFDAL